MTAVRSLRGIFPASHAIVWTSDSTLTMSSLQLARPRRLHWQSSVNRMSRVPAEFEACGNQDPLYFKARTSFEFKEDPD